MKVEEIGKIVGKAIPQKEGWSFNAAFSADTVNRCKPENAKWVIFSGHNLKTDKGKIHAIPLPAILVGDEKRLTSMAAAVYRQIEHELREV